MLVTWFEPQPSRDELPVALNSPFDTEEPPPLAIRAAVELRRELAAIPGLYGPEGGKMFGVLVVEDRAGRVGYVKAFSGQLGGAWDVGGFVPPIFDRAAREAIEPAGEALVKSLTARVEEARRAPEWAAIERERVELEERIAREERDLRERHRKNREARKLERAKAAAPHLDQLSRRDHAELRDAKQRWRTEREEVGARHRRAARRIAALERLRKIVSREVAIRIFDTYPHLRELFSPSLPSSGTGDCAAPKLLTYAIRNHLRPLALAELWWGAPPPGGGRVEGAYYPACKEKCGPLLPHLLAGISVAPERRFRPPDLRKFELPILFRDERIIAIDKPAGLLSVPGTDATVTDSVLERMRAQFPHATGPLLVHRLDLETSGVLLVALDAEAHALLQRQFIHREVEKRYVAVLSGEVTRDSGIIELPLRVDLEQRPRQIVDFIHGKKARTRFEVLARDAARGETRVVFYPETGRTHQLRVHAAHRDGLAAPIAGDRLYGREGPRLMLHAESLAFRHPTTGERIEVRAPAPF